MASSSTPQVVTAESDAGPDHYKRERHTGVKVFDGEQHFRRVQVLVVECYDTGKGTGGEKGKPTKKGVDVLLYGDDTDEATLHFGLYVDRTGEVIFSCDTKLEESTQGSGDDIFLGWAVEVDEALGKGQGKGNQRRTKGSSKSNLN